MRGFSHDVPGDQRQIISEKGIPVRIAKNPEGTIHHERVSLGVGGMIEMGKIQDPILQEEARLQRREQEFQARLQSDAYARVLETHPDATLEYVDYPLTAAMMESILAEDADRQKEKDEIRAALEAVTQKRYQFKVQSPESLYVGKEGTLVYSLQTGEQATGELGKAVVWEKGENGVSYPNPEWAKRIAELRERMRSAEHVADIHQIEVLPEYQGRGLAGALLDVALWDIEHTKDGVEFSVARILSDNPDGDKMIAVFKKAGFDAFDGGSVCWDDPRHFTLVVRENPHFKSRKDRATS